MACCTSYVGYSPSTRHHDAPSAVVFAAHAGGAPYFCFGCAYGTGGGGGAAGSSPHLVHGPHNKNSPSAAAAEHDKKSRQKKQAGVVVVGPALPQPQVTDSLS